MRADPVVATLAAVSALAVIDGDTFRIGAARYRLLGIDAAEIHLAQCDAERRLGELTLEALAGSGQIDLRADRPGQRDRYGRLLVRLFVNGEDAACVLIREGMPAPGAAAARIGASTSTRLRAWRGLSVPLPLRRAARLSELSPLRRVQRTGPPASL
jgi:micrococcal nuclease